MPVWPQPPPPPGFAAGPPLYGPMPRTASAQPIPPPHTPPARSVFESMAADGLEGNLVVHFFYDTQGVLQRLLYVAVLRLEGDTVKWHRYKLIEGQGDSILEVLERDLATRLNVSWGLPEERFFLPVKLVERTSSSQSQPRRDKEYIINQFTLLLSRVPLLTYSQRRQISAMQARRRRGTASGSVQGSPTGN